MSEIWSPQQANDWYARVSPIVGCNYLPRTAVNSTEMWQAQSFDPETIDEELGWAAAAGYNSLRIFVQYLVWLHDPDGLLQRMDRLLSIAAGHGITATFILFDDCAFAGREPYLGVQDDPKPGVHNSGWLKCPGRKLLQAYDDGSITGSDRARLKNYVQDLMERYRDDRRILMWDLYNEPNQPVTKTLLEDTWAWAREVGPSQPLTGCFTGAGPDYRDYHAEQSDVLTFHCYNTQSLQEIIDRLRKAHPGRPIICTEYMGRPNSTFKGCLPILKENHVGAINWGLVNGKSGTVWHWPSQKAIRAIVEKPGWSLAAIESGHGFDRPTPGENYPEPEAWFHDIFRVDGTPYDAAETALIRELVGRREVSGE